MDYDITAIAGAQLPRAVSRLAEATAAFRGLNPGVSLEGRGDERARVAELAREFEAMMTRQVLQQMRESTLGDEDHGLGSATMTGTVDFELARLLAEGGRALGLADALQPALERQAAQAAVGPAAAAGGVDTVYTLRQQPAATPVEDEAPAVPLPLGDRITSSFGWRDDPLGAGRRFHLGVDIAAPQGRAVPAVADGCVAFAGKAAGYGNTVVVEHADGTSTRYAHLAEIAVRQSDAVAAGHRLGTVGSTGRSTGPHLHFELLKDGRAVNPEHAAARFAALLKNTAVVAD